MLTKINIAICDDESEQVLYLESLVADWAAKRNICVSIHPFCSAEAFAFVWSEDKSCDILLLDIEMRGDAGTPPKNGVELAKEIRQCDQSLSIIFITGYPDFMAEGYEVSALHYLMKPVNKDKLYDTLDRALHKISVEPKTLLVFAHGAQQRILQRDIIYLEAFAHKTVIVTTSGRLEVTQSISWLEKALDSDAFVRCHRSYLVGLAYIRRITKTDVELDDGTAILLSRRLYTAVNQQFIRFYRGDGG